MKRSSLIGHTVELLDAYRGGRQPADAVLKQYYRTRGYLGAKDRRAISEWYFAILRNTTLLEVLATEARQLSGVSRPAGKAPSIVLLSALLVRILHDDVGSLGPDLAPAWGESSWGVALDEFLPALVSVQLPQRIMENPVSRIAVEQSIPEFIVSEWSKEYGDEQTELLCSALNQPAPTTVRVNTLRCARDVCREAFRGEAIDSEPTRLSPSGLILSKRININELRLFQDGWFEMQDEGSQLLTLLLEPVSGQCIVDACAGGGGKTLHLGALLGNTGRIFAIDTDDRRQSEIAPRASRAGVSIVKLLHGIRDRGVIAGMAKAADSVLIDAPCSGIGAFRRNPGSKPRVTPQWVEELTKVQSSVLDQYVHMVKTGGRLVYTTCTLLRAENEEQAESFRSRHPEFSLLDASTILRRQGIEVSSDSPYLRLLPHRTGTDGFFAAVFERDR